MTTYALTGNDTFILDGCPNLRNDLADGSTINITGDSDSIGTATGKNNNTIFSDNRQGSNATVELRVLAGTKTDKDLNALSLRQDKDLPSFPLMSGTFAKRIGDGAGSITFLNYVLLGGVFKRKFPDVQENLNGETEQGVAVWTLFFAQCQRAII